MVACPQRSELPYSWNKTSNVSHLGMLAMKPEPKRDNETL